MAFYLELWCYLCDMTNTGSSLDNDTLYSCYVWSQLIQIKVHLMPIFSQLLPKISYVSLKAHMLQRNIQEKVIQVH